MSDSDYDEASDPEEVRKPDEYSDDEPEERKDDETDSEMSDESSQEEPDEGSALPTHYKFVLDLDNHKYTGKATLHTREKPYFFSAHEVTGAGDYPPSKIRTLIHSLKVTPKMMTKKGTVKIIIRNRGSLRLTPA